MFELKFHSVPSARRLTKALTPGETLGVGREDGDLRFPEDGLMSSFHLTLTANSHAVSFQDEGSTNGSFLNGQRISRGTLGPDDTLVIGQTHITVTLTREPEQIRAEKKPGPEKPGPDKYESVKPGPGSRDRTSSTPTARGTPALRIEGSEATERVLQPGQQLSVGRTEKSEWIFPDDDLMSGRHFVLSDTDGQWQVYDCNSLNGTFLNNERIEQAVLKSGDSIEAGRGSFRVWFEKIDPSGRLSTIEDSEESLPLTATATSQAASASDTVSSSDGFNTQVAYLWLANLAGQGMSICLKQGSQVRFQHGASQHSRLCIDWLGAGCSVYVEGAASSEFMINDELARRAELREGDVLHWSGTSYQVTYSENPQTISLPQVSSISDTQPLIAPAVEEIQPESKGPADGQDEADIITPVLVKAPTKSHDSASETASVKNAHVMQGTLPSIEPIEVLLDVARHGKCWLVSVDPSHSDQLSVPAEITINDPSWMMQVQAGWPATCSSLPLPMLRPKTYCSRYWRNRPSRYRSPWANASNGSKRTSSCGEQHRCAACS